MGRFGRGSNNGGGRSSDRDRVLSSYNSNRKRILGSRSDDRSFTISRNGGGNNNNNNNNRGSGGRRDGGRRDGGRRSPPTRRREENGAGRRQGGGLRRDRSGIVRRSDDRQVGKRDRTRNTRVGKRVGGGGSDRDRPRRGGDAPRRVRKGDQQQGRPARVGGSGRRILRKKGLKKNNNNNGSTGPVTASSMDNMLEAYQQGKNEQEIRNAGRVAQIQSRLDDALSNYQNGPAAKNSSSSSAKSGNPLDNSLEAYMKGS